MLRSIAKLGRRALCTTASIEAKPSAFHQRVRTMMDTLLEEDWTDSEEARPVDLHIEKADTLINEYRTIYTADTSKDDELYKDVEKLYFMKEVTSIVEAYGSFADRKVRRHEGVLGFMGDNTNIPDGEGEETIEIFRDYIALMGKIDDEELRTKVELELGRKMVHLKMFVSMENFSLKVAPIAGDRILPVTPQAKELPKAEEQGSLPSKANQ